MEVVAAPRFGASLPYNADGSADREADALILDVRHRLAEAIATNDAGGVVHWTKACNRYGRAFQRPHRNPGGAVADRPRRVSNGHAWSRTVADFWS